MDNEGKTPEEIGQDEITSNSLKIRDTGKLQLGTTSGGGDNTTYPCMTMLFTAGSTLKFGDVVKMVNDGSGNPVASIMLATDDGRTGVVGTANEAAITGQQVKVCVGGAFSAVANGAFSIGDLFGRSTVVNGRVAVTSGGSRVFGISMTNTTQGNILTGLFIRNEST